MSENETLTVTLPRLIRTPPEVYAMPKVGGYPSKPTDDSGGVI